MSHLLKVSHWPSKAVERGATPLIMDFKVNPETAPYLVTSSEGLMWIEEPLGQEDGMGILRSAVQEVPVGDVFSRIVKAVLEMGCKRDWGNIHPLTEEGIQGAFQHLAYYDFDDVEVLAPLSEDDAARKLLKGMGRSYRPCQWMPDEHLVIVPQDRSFVGEVGFLSPKRLAGVVHNASRGIAVVTSTLRK